MSDATDVLQAVDQLRRDLSGYHGQLKAHNDLQRHCDHQRERIAELEAIHARDKAENAKLREERDNYKALWDHATVTDCELRRVRAAWKEDREKNAKLMELVRELWDGYMDPPCEDCPLKDRPTCANCPICAREASVIDRMRDLGVEVTA